MANTIQIKRKTTTGAPSIEDLEVGELCLVVPDEVLYIKVDALTIIDVNRISELVEDLDINNKALTSLITSLATSDYANLLLARNLTNNTPQRIGILAHHPNLSEEEVTLFSAYLDSVNAKLLFGGGSSIKNAVREISFYTAGNNTTLAGVLAMRVLNTQNICIGSEGTATEKLQVHGNVKANGYKSSDGSLGITGSFTLQSGETVTVKNGLITSVI